MIRVLCFSIFLILVSMGGFAQKNLGIGTDKPNPNAILDLNVENPASTPQGLLLPRLTSVQRTLLGTNLGGVKGMSVYDITDNEFYIWDGSQWNKSGAFTVSGTGGITVTQVGNNFVVDGGGLSANQWTTTGANLYYDKGNVGIGSITNPFFKLDVSGGINVTHAKFGEVAPVYIYSGSPGIGFNAYWNASNYIFGQGSSNNGAGIIGFNISPTNPAFEYVFSSSPGNDGGIVSPVIPVRIGINGISVNTGLPAQQALEVNGNASITGITYLGSIVGNDLSGAAGSIVTVDGAGKLGIGTLPGQIDQWVSSGSNILYTSSLVGIGTATPNEQFTVQGNSSVAGTSYSQSLNVFQTGNQASFFTTDATIASQNYLEFHSGRYNSNNNRADATWQIGLNQFAVPSDDDYWGIGRNNIGYDLVVNRAGNTGIGTVTPNEQLTVFGNSSVSGTSFTNGLQINGLGAPSGSVLTVDGSGLVGYGTVGGSQWATNGSDVYYSTGNVGIGSSNTTSKLHIKQSTQVNDNLTDIGSGFYGAGITFENNGSIDKFYMGYGFGGIFRIGKGTASNVFVPVMTLDEGSVVVLGTITSNNLKITDLSNGILSVNGVGNVVTTSISTGSDWIQASSNQIYTNSFVGIGVSNPSQPLAVGGSFGTIKTSALFSDGSFSTVRISHPATGVAAIGAIVNQQLIFGGMANDDSSFNPYMTIQSNGATANIGVGTTLPGESLVVVGNSSVTGTTFTNNLKLIALSNGILSVDGVGNVVTTSISNSDQWTTSGSNLYYDQGNVAIGSTFTTNASAPTFLVTGDRATSAPDQIVIAGSGGNNDRQLLIGYNTTGNYGVIQSVQQLVSVTPLILQSNGGKVGIGTVNPNEDLTVFGNSSISGIGYFGTLIGNNLTGAPGSVVTVDGAGMLGLGTLNLSSQWITTTSGNIFFNGSRIGVQVDPQFDVHVYNPTFGPYTRYETPSTGGLFSAIEFKTGLYNVDGAPTSSNSIWQIGFTQVGTVSNPEDRLFLGRAGLSSKDFGLYRDGNIGIGLSNSIVPNEKLTVQGNSSVIGIGYFGTIVGNNLTGAAGSVVTVDGAGKLGLGQFAANNWQNSGANSVHLTGGNVGINIPNPTGARLEVGGNNFSTSGAGAEEVARFGSNDNTALRLGIWIKTDPIVNDQYMALNAISVGNRNLLLQSTGGNVGIGTSLPSEKLQVEGNMSITGIAYLGTIIGNNLTGAAGSIITVDGAGKLGLGTAAAGSQWITTVSGIYYSTSVGVGMLPIAGNTLNIKSSGNSTKPIRVEYSGTTFPMFEVDQGSGGQTNFMMYDNAGVKFVQLGVATPSYFNGTSNFGIGTINANEKFTVQGNASISGIGYFGTIIGDNLVGAAGSVITVDGTGKLGLGSISAGSQWLTTSTGIIYNGGYVGIGTGLPSNLFEIHQLTVTNTNMTASVLDVTHGGGSGAKIASMINYSIAGTGGTDNYKGLLLNMSGNNSGGTSANYGVAVNYNVTGTRDAVGFVANMPSNNTGLKKGLFVNISGAGPQNIGLDVNVSNGTTNYAALFNGGNVGIGTNIPDERLVVAGNSSTSGIGYFGTIIGNNLTGAAGSIITVDGLGKLGLGSMGASSQWLSTGVGIYYGTSVGIGLVPHNNQPLVIKSTGNATTVFGIVGATTTSHIITLNEEGGSGLLKLYNNLGGQRSQVSAFGNTYFLDNVGIGTQNAPNGFNKLLIKGNASITGGTFGVETLTSGGVNLVSALPDGTLTITGQTISPSTWNSTSPGMTYTNDKVAIGANTVTGNGIFKVGGDGSMGGMAITSQSLVNPLSTASNTYVTLIMVPVYIPAGTINVEFNVIGSALTGNGDFQLDINGTTSSVINIANATPVLGTPVSLNVAALSGWQVLKINARYNAGGNNIVLNGYTVIVKN